MIDHRHGRVFSYTVPHKGVLGEAEYVPSRMVRDIDNMGYKDVCVQIKSDQEPAIIFVQEYIKIIYKIYHAISSRRLLPQHNIGGTEGGSELTEGPFLLPRREKASIQLDLKQ